MKENTTVRKITVILLLIAAITASVLYGKKLAGRSEHHNRRISYLEEKKERELIRRMSSDLDAAEERYRKELINANVNYPTLWIHQAEAVLDRREMVELRHELVARRQGLRKRIDYNTDNRDAAKREVEDLVAKYPNYAREILDIVSTYE